MMSPARTWYARSAAGIWLMNATISGVTTAITIQTCAIRNPPRAIGSNLRLHGRASSYPHGTHVFCFGGRATPPERNARTQRVRCGANAGSYADRYVQVRT